MPDDVSDIKVSKREFQLKKLEQIRSVLAEARKTGDWDKVPSDVYEDYLRKIVLTSAPSLANYRDFLEIDFISADVVYAMKLSDSGDVADEKNPAEQSIQQANEGVLHKIRAKALGLNADAVISLDIKHVLIGGTDDEKQFLVNATGTAVRFD